MDKFQIVDFRFAEVTDIYDLKYREWSRIYEYPYVIDFIEEYKRYDLTIPDIHNTSWGYEGVHVIFRDELDTLGKCLHSDICHSKYRDTFYYDITTEAKDFENKFDFVVNISTIEHLNTVKERLTAIQYLFKQVKPGGFLILTFDYPRVNLVEIEELVGEKCKKPVNALNGKNSANPNMNYSDLNIIYLILKNNE